MKTMLGNYHSLAQWYESRCARPFSFLDRRWNDPDTWRVQARGKVLQLLSYEPPDVALDGRVEESLERDGVRTERVSWAQPFGPRTEAFVVRPAGTGTGSELLPGVVALHDHSGFYYYGKEKITAVPDEPALLRRLKEEEYGGASWANELARRGYVVLAPDSFLWGSRRLDPAMIPEDLTGPVLRERPGSPSAITAYNSFVSGHEAIIAKTLFLSGTTWTGIMAWEDRRAVDYMLTRSDVDPARLGCGGLSGGGLRAIYLSALDPRISCALCVGFMSTLDEMPADVVRRHTWMFHVPHLASEMDMSDVVSLHAPGPLMVQYDTEDPLWTLDGQKKADAKIRAVYAKMADTSKVGRHAAGRYAGTYYPGPHKFDLAMQKDAFDWFDKWLK
jgi:dienelactone hydrolase